MGLMVAPVWTGALLPLATAILLTYVGFLVLRRQTGARDRLALRMFALWWVCAGVVILLASMPTQLTLLGVADVGILQAITYVNAAPLAVGLCGLLYYLVYIYTGRQRAIIPIVIAYAAFFAFEIYYFSQFGARSLESTAWSVRSVSAVRPPPWMSVLFGIAVALPILVAAVGYGSLLARVDGPEQRYRITLVSGAFLLWFAPLLLAFLVGWDDADWFPLLYQAPGVVAGLLIVLAYRPPAFVARRWVGAALG